MIYIYFYKITFYTGLHPRILTEGFDVARVKALEILESIKIPIEVKRSDLLDVARTSLKTKVCLRQLITAFVLGYIVLIEWLP